MTESNPPHPLTPILHWTVGLGVIGMLILGFYMSETNTYGLYPLHKSIGVLLGLIIVARVIWRLSRGFLAPVGPRSAWEQRLARASQWILLLASLAMPLSGFLYSGLAGAGVEVFGVTVFPRNVDPANPGQRLPHSAGGAEFFETVHGITAWLIVVVLGFHMAGALKHHFIDRDATLTRMLGLRGRGR